MNVSLIAAVALGLMACSVEASFDRRDWTGIRANIRVPTPKGQVGPAKRAYHRNGRKDQVVDDQATPLIEETTKILDDLGLPNVSQLFEDLTAALKKFIKSQVQR